MQYYQHSRRSRPQRHKTVRELTEEATWSEGMDTDRKTNDKIESRVTKLEEALREKRKIISEMRKNSTVSALSESREAQELRGRVYQLEMALKEAGGKPEAAPSSVSQDVGPRESLCYRYGEKGHVRSALCILGGGQREE